MKTNLLLILLFASSIVKAQITNGLAEEFRFNGSGLSESGTAEFTSLTTYGEDRNGNPNSCASMHAGFYTSITGLPSGNTDRTISVWINPTSVNSDNIIFCYGNPSGNSVYGGSFSQTQLYNFTYSQNLPYFTSIATNIWKHVAYTFEQGAIAKIYVDGALAQTGTLNNILTGSANSNFYLGTLIGGSTSGAFNGYFDDLAIYNRALSAAEILSLYNSCQLSTEITQNGTTISATQSGANYQWINCANNTPISGANSQTFTATTNGSYAVIITSGVCSDTSECTNFSTIGLNENELAAFAIYPNPATEQVTISNIEAGSTVTLVDVTGKTVSQQLSNSTSVKLQTSALTSGVYFVRVMNNNGISGTQKLVIE